MSGDRVNFRAVVHILECTQIILNEYGWIQGKLHSPEGYCLVGALHKADRDLNAWYQNTEVALIALANTLTAKIGHHSGVGQWNDLKSTKREDVDALIEETIARYIANEQHYKETFHHG